MVSTAKTVISMTNAVEGVTYKKMSAADAARLFQKDLIDLTKTTIKLTDDEERAVILCCLRLCRMGFSVQKDTVMSKCQEMFARRYATTSAVPISDTYCLDLYVRNMPLFTPEIEITNSNPLRERFNIHYSALHRLYKSLWPQTTPTARNILVLDLKQFNLDKEPGFNTLRSVAVTVLSAMSACTSRSLPVMAVWPKRVISTHLSLINVDSKRGMPTHFHVNQYLQVILSIVRERPLVIVCNGNASLLSERLITSSLSDWVYFYCVPPDIAKYVFPGFHGGLLYMLKDQLPNQGLNCGEVATRLMHLLEFKKQSIALSSSLAFTTTGVFPFNSRARIQYQTVNVNTTPHQSYSQQKFSNWAGRQLSQPPGEDCKFKTAEGSGDDKVRAESIMNQEEERRGLTEKDKVQQKDKTENKVINSDPTKPGLIVKTRKKATITRKQAHRHLTCAQVLAKKLLSQAKHRHESSHAVTLEIIMAPQSADTNVKRGATRSSVRTGHKQSIQTCHRKPEVPFTEKAKELVGSRTETEVRNGQKQSIQTCHSKSRVPSTEQADELVGSSTEGEVAQTAVATHSRAVGDRISSQDERTEIAVTSNGWSSTRAQPDTSRKLDTKKPTSSYSGSSEASKTSPLIGSSSAEQVGRGKSGIRLLISNVRNNNRPSTVLVNHPHSKKYSNSEEESDSGDDMEMDDVIEDTLNKDVDDNIEDNRNPSSLKSDMVISSDRNNHKEDKNKRSKKRKRQSSEGGEEKVNVDKYGENSISENPVEENKKEDEKHQLGQKIPETSGAPDKKTSKVDTAGDASVSKLEDSPKAGDKASFDREEERKLKLLSHISLIDHDYIIKFDRSERNSSGNKSDDSSEPPESCEIPDDQEVEITASNVKTSKGISATGAIYGKGHKDIILAAASEDLTETVQCSVQYESIEESAKSDHDISGSSSSSNNNGYTSSSSNSDVEKSESSSPVKSHCNNTTNGAEENSSSSSSDSSASDNDNDDHQEDDGSTGGDNSDDNGQTSDVDEEEEDSDDDSKCQICMRSTPPHSKDTIIDWVDCDQNCGRWFHVICVSRSQSKGDTKSYICPSCRCQR